MPASAGKSRSPAMSAVPRWSHRDPVEGGNPFCAGDPRRARWEEATARAQTALKRYDAALAAHPLAASDPSVYATQWLDLATMRFDTWARRGLAAVDNSAAQHDYAAWLQTLVANWRAYVADTCPHVTGDVRAELASNLQARAEHWAEEARHRLDNASRQPAVTPPGDVSESAPPPAER